MDAAHIPPPAQDTGGLWKLGVFLVAFAALLGLIVAFGPKPAARPPPCSADPDFIVLKAGSNGGWWFWFYNQKTGLREVTDRRPTAYDLRNDLYGLSQAGLLNETQIKCADALLGGVR